MVRYGIRVREIMTRNPISVSMEDSIGAAAKLMKEHGIGSLIVLDSEKKLVGIITEGDIMKKAFLKNKPTKTKIKYIMTKDVITIHPDDDLYHVSHLMNQKNIRKLPVVEGRNVVGYLTEKDLLKIEPGIMDVLIEKLKVKHPELRLTYTLRR
jgi:signal-transduction protein with cAMP-binding, CBS, and nucleotidyltransferase domain